MLSKTTDAEPCLIPQPVDHSGQFARLELALLDPSHRLRVDAEAFVQTVFYAAYRARLDSFYPLLMSIKYPAGDYAAVAGIRPAGGESLFSEYYLDTPIEEMLNIERREIVEIGNLAPASAGQARWLICTLTSFLTGAGFKYVVFTAVPRLQNAFRRMGLPLTKHAVALQAMLPVEQRENWGSYYANRPAVCSGEIQVGYAAFGKIMGVDPDLHDVSRRAFDAGRLFANQSACSPNEQNPAID